MSVKLLALRSGFTTLTVTYQYNDIILKAAITVGAYHALKVSTNKELDCAKDMSTENCFECFLIKYNPKVLSTNSSFPLFLLKCFVVHFLVNTVTGRFQEGLY